MSEEPEQTELETKQEPEPKPTDDLEGLDDRARAIVEDARRDAAKSRRDLRAAQSAADEARKQAETIRSQHESEQEKAIREAVEQARGEERSKWQRDLLEAQVTAQAAGKLADPDDAISLLPLEDLLAEEDAERRKAKVEKAIADLLEQKPYLAAGANGGDDRGRGRELVTQGPRSDAPTKTEDRSADDWLRSARARR